MSTQTPSTTWYAGDIRWYQELPESSRRMVEAALDAFAEHGFHGTTTRDIATRAGMSPAALYVHFSSKGALLAQISRVGHAAAVQLVDEAITTADDPLGRLRAVVARFAAWHAAHHRAARVVQHELAALPPADREVVLAMRQRIERQVADLVREGVAVGQMRVDKPREVARALLSLSVDVARWYDPAGRDTPEAIGALYGELAGRIVGAGP
jgi:AcrR family transcriptional regulator